MIKFSNGHQLDFACGSGALAFDGRGWPWEYIFRWGNHLRPQDMTVVAKTVTDEPKKGNLRWWKPWACVSLIPDGVANAVGLTNPGIRKWVKKYYPISQKLGYKIAASIDPLNFTQLQAMAYLLKDCKLAYIEINLSCPNTHGKDLPFHPNMTDVRPYLYGKPIVVKLSYNQATNKHILFRLSRIKGIEALHLINTVPWSDVFPDTVSPLEKHLGVKGGVSGKPAKQFAIKAIDYAHQRTKLPIIGGNGIMSYEDVLDFERVGASAFSIGSLFLRHPTLPNKIIDQYRREHELK